MKLTKKTASMAVAGVALAATMTVAGTFALLTDSQTLLNTFSWGHVDVALTETDTGQDQDGEGTTNQYQMVPGATVDKDPQVTVKAGETDCWLLVQLEESAEFADVLAYEMARGWEPLQVEGVQGVWWRHVEASEADQTFRVIANNQLQVVGDANAIRALQEEPTLKVTAFAVQTAGVKDAAEAWQIAKSERSNG